MIGVCRTCGWIAFPDAGCLTIPKCRCGGEVVDIKAVRKALGVERILHVLNTPPSGRVRALAAKR